jgi:hypothetical protein
MSEVWDENLSKIARGCLRIIVKGIRSNLNGKITCIFRRECRIIGYRV